MDEEERVWVLQGIRALENENDLQPVWKGILAVLSENVVHRMKDPNPSTEGQHPAPLPATLDQDCTAPQKEPKLQRSETIDGRQPSGVKEDLKRFRQEQATVQDELLQVVEWEREAAAKHLTAAPPVVEGSADQEKQQSAWLNAEMYKLSSQQFHEAAMKAENTIKPRRVEPMCSGLQAQILRCYRDHVHEVLRCSDLVKAYQRCVCASSAHKG